MSEAVSSFVQELAVLIDGDIGASAKWASEANGRSKTVKLYVIQEGGGVSGRSTTRDNMERPMVNQVPREDYCSPGARK